MDILARPIAPSNVSSPASRPAVPSGPVSAPVVALPGTAGRGGALEKAEDLAAAKGLSSPVKLTERQSEILREVQAGKSDGSSLLSDLKYRGEDTQLLAYLRGQIKDGQPWAILLLSRLPFEALRNDPALREAYQEAAAQATQLLSDLAMAPP